MRGRRSPLLPPEAPWIQPSNLRGSAPALPPSIRPSETPADSAAPAVSCAKQDALSFGTVFGGDIGVGITRAVAFGHVYNPRDGLLAAAAAAVRPHFVNSCHEAGGDETCAVVGLAGRSAAGTGVMPFKQWLPLFVLDMPWRGLEEKLIHERLDTTPETEWEVHLGGFATFASVALRNGVEATLGFAAVPALQPLAVPLGIVYALGTGLSALVEYNVLTRFPEPHRWRPWEPTPWAPWRGASGWPYLTGRSTVRHGN